VIEFRLAVLVYRCLSGTAPQYLAYDLQRVADIGTRRRLRSASSSSQYDLTSSHITNGDPSFIHGTSLVGARLE